MTRYQLRDLVSVGVALCAISAPTATLAQINTRTSAEIIASLRGWISQLTPVMEKPKQYCSTGNKPDCLRAAAFDAGVARVNAAIQELSSGKDQGAILSDNYKVHAPHSLALREAGLGVDLARDCWHQGGQPCVRIEEAMPGKGMTAVGHIYAHWTINAALTNKKPPPLPNR